MRKLSTIHLKDAEVLNETQLKQIYGGSGASPADCTATCGEVEVIQNGSVIRQRAYASLTCPVICAAVDGSGVFCDNAHMPTLSCTAAEAKLKENLGGSSGATSFA